MVDDGSYDDRLSNQVTNDGWGTFYPNMISAKTVHFPTFCCVDLFELRKFGTFRTGSNVPVNSSRPNCNAPTKSVATAIKCPKRYITRKTIRDPSLASLTQALTAETTSSDLESTVESVCFRRVVISLKALMNC